MGSFSEDSSENNNNNNNNNSLFTLKKIQIHSVIDKKLQMRVKATCNNHKG